LAFERADHRAEQLTRVNLKPSFVLDELDDFNAPFPKLVFRDIGLRLPEPLGESLLRQPHPLYTRQPASQVISSCSLRMQQARSQRILSRS
jgi:hypothetical protein